MSGESVEVVRRHFAAFAEGGLDAVARYWQPDVEWRAAEGAADDVGVMRGEEALRRYYEDWISTFDDLRAEVDEVLLDEGDRVAVSVRNSGRGRASGVVTHGRYYVVCTVRDGRIASGREYVRREEALAAFRELP